MRRRTCARARTLWSRDPPSSKVPTMRRRFARCERRRRWVCARGPQGAKGARGGGAGGGPRLRGCDYPVGLFVVLVVVIIVVVIVLLGARRLAGRSRSGLDRHDEGARLHFRARIEHHDGLAGGAQEALLFQHFEYASRYFTRTAD